MERQRTRDTAPEVALRSELHRLGLRYRVHARPIADVRRVADVIFRSAHLAVFVDGCFWHSCPDHGGDPKTNSGWWRDKLEGNRERDIETDAALRRAGWEVVRVWEHEDPAAAARRIRDLVRSRRRATTLNGVASAALERPPATTG
jgi:DNA mismatch endonuclease (patch repair protein)